MKISKLLLWKDVGFNDGSVEVPSYAECLKIIDSTADNTLGNLAASANRMFSELKLPLTYTEAREYSYLKMEYDSKSYYGWIDSVEIVSDTVVDEQHRYSEVLVRWHVDLWRTYYTSASLGYGRVTRRIGGLGITMTPPQNPAYIAKIYSKAMTDPYGGDVWWVCIACTGKLPASEGETGEKITWQGTRFFPVKVFSTDEQYKYWTEDHGGRLKIRRKAGDNEYYVPNLYDVVFGNFSELLGVAPSQIQSVYISPVAPMKYTVYNGVYQLDLIQGAGTQYREGVGIDKYNPTELAAFFATFDTFDELQSQVPQGLIGLSTSDTQSVVVLDCFRNIVATLPYGFTIETFNRRLVKSGSEFWAVYRLVGDDSAAMGMEIKVPLPSFPLSSNSWSEYVFSGERSVAVESKRLQNLMTLGNGLVGTATGAGQGAILGGVKGGAYGTNVMMGASIGAITSSAGALASYGLGKMFNDRLQDLEDYAKANQLDTTILSGSSNDFIRYGLSGVTFGLLSVDSYSATRFQNSVQLNGYKVDEPTADCSTYQNRTGPLQIRNLIVYGNIPVEAKNYIKQRFDDGIRLITTNLVGDKPQSGAVNE